MKVWSEHVTKDGKLYYYNKVTKQSLWEKPSDFDATTETSAILNDQVEDQENAMEWEELWDPKNERFYYFNRTTRKTQWQKPENVTIKPCTTAPSRKKKSEATVTSSTTTDEEGEQAGDEEKPSKNEEEETKSITTKTTEEPIKEEEEEEEEEKNQGEALGVKQEEEEEEKEKEKTSRQKVKSKSKNNIMTLEQEEEQEEEDDVLLENDKKKRKKKHKHNNGSSKKSKHHQHHQHHQKNKAMIIIDEQERENHPTQNQNQNQNQKHSKMLFETKQDSRSIEEKKTKDGQEATRLLKELSQCDGIMEPNVLQVINGFLRTYKGNNGPELLVEKLSTSYRGKAQMIGLVASWLDGMPVSKTAMEKKITSFDATTGNVQIVPGSIHTTTTMNDTSSPSTGSILLPNTGIISGINLKTATWQHADEMLYQHLKQTVKSHYEPKLLSNVLNDSAVEPEWLKQMLTEQKWRQLLIELAETHQTCSLLQYAIRRISEAGHHKEIAAITTANAFYSVFNGVLADAFKRIPFESEKAIQQEDLVALKKSCRQSAYSYLYTQELLCTLDTKLYQQQVSNSNSDSESDTTYLRNVRAKLNQVRLELQEATFHQVDSGSDSGGGGGGGGGGGIRMEALHPLKRKALQEKKLTQWTMCHTALLTLFTTRKCTEQVLETLVKSYQVSHLSQAPSSSSSPPPVAHLRDPMILYCLLDSLFNPSSENHLSSVVCIQHCIHLLAYLSCTKDERSILTSSTSSTSISTIQVQVQVDQQVLKETKKALQTSSSICQSDNTLGYNMHQSGEVEKLIHVMEKIPIVSMGVLYWLQVTLKTPSFYNGPLLSLCFPSLLKILRTSIRHHTAQWPLAFGVLVTSLRLHPEGMNPVKALELKRQSLRCMVLMMTSGYVLPVLEFVYKNIFDLDLALLRNFITMVLARVAPPFSIEFMIQLTHILIHPKVQNAIKTCPADTKYKLKIFVTQCKKQKENFVPEQLQALMLTTRQDQS